MSSGQRHKFAYEQELGVDPDYSVQQDRVRVEVVRVASGTKLLLAVVADGDGNINAGEAAELLINQVFETVQKSNSNDIHAVLVAGLEAGSKIIPVGSRVAVTAIAVKSDQVYLAHAGHTSAHLVRKGKSYLLTHSSEDLLGKSSAPRILTNSTKREVIQAGDNIVLCSDGLTVINPDDGKSYVDPKDLSGLIADNTPMEAARHIISIAMGRDAKDNLSAIVIQGPGREQGGRKWGLLAMAALILVILLTVRIFQPGDEDELHQAVDYGYAVVVSGSALVATTEGEGKEVNKLGTIPPLTVVEAQELTRLALKSNVASSIEVSLITVYLSSESKLSIQSIDSQQDVGGQGASPGSFPTSLRYLEGSVLILRLGGAQRVQVEVGEIVASLTGAGRAILSVRTSEGMIYVDCLQGGCSYEKGGELGVPFNVGQSLSISRSANEPMEITSLLADSITFWDDLCSGCIQTP